MNQEYWKTRWADNNIAWHEDDGNALLDSHIHLMNDPTWHVFVPLCGKSYDLITLNASVESVTGAELDQGAVEAFFRENKMQPMVTQVGKLRKYEANGITIYQGDFFELKKHHLGEVNAVFDRAALVAMPPEMRARYAAHLWEITDGAKQLLVTYEYEPNGTMQGPPFSVTESEIEALYEEASLMECDRQPITGSLTQRTEGFEVCWELTS